MDTAEGDNTEGPAVPDDQGNLGVCTRTASEKSKLVILIKDKLQLEQTLTLRSLEQPPDHHLNVNKGVQGGNFVHSHLHKPTFNNQSPSGRLSRENYQIIRFIGEGTYGKTFKVQPKNVHTRGLSLCMNVSDMTIPVSLRSDLHSIIHSCENWMICSAF